MTRGRVPERGVALVTTLLAVTLLTIAVVEFAYSSQVDYHLAYNALRSLQASSLARSGVNLAIGVLKKDGGSVSNIDSLGDLWARPLPPLPVGEGMVLVRVTDEQGKLNLNALRTPSGGIDQSWQQVAERLFVSCGLDSAVLEPILDWLDADDAPEPRGAERDHYTHLTPPTTPRNGLFLTEGELGRVKDMTEQVRARLHDVVTVLPTSASPRINVNTAPADVLSALFPEVDQQLLAQFVASRGETPVQGANELKTRLALPPNSKTDQMISVRSDFFTIVALATVEPVSQALTVRVQRRARMVTPLSWRTTLPVTERKG
jgi:general secretion pathway protein K